jgi:hypothetical protein
LDGRGTGRRSTRIIRRTRPGFRQCGFSVDFGRQYATSSNLPRTNVLHVISMGSTTTTEEATDACHTLPHNRQTAFLHFQASRSANTSRPVEDTDFWDMNRAQSRPKPRRRSGPCNDDEEGETGGGTCGTTSGGRGGNRSVSR